MESLIRPAIGKSRDCRTKCERKRTGTKAKVEESERWADNSFAATAAAERKRENFV